MPNRAQRRATGKSYPSVSEWEHARTVTVELDDDFIVDLELPDIGVFAATDKSFPNPLRAAVATLDKAIADETQLSDEEIQNHLALQTYIIARQLRKPNLVAELGSVEKAQEWILERMPPKHRHLLWQYCIFHQSGEAVLRSLADLTSFRGNGAGAESGGSGEPDGASAK
jgi:hypothetical protein